MQVATQLTANVTFKALGKLPSYYQRYFIGLTEHSDSYLLASYLLVDWKLGKLGDKEELPCIYTHSLQLLGSTLATFIP